MGVQDRLVIQKLNNLASGRTWAAKREPVNGVIRH